MFSGKIMDTIGNVLLPGKVTRGYLAILVKIQNCSPRKSLDPWVVELTKCISIAAYQFLLGIDRPWLIRVDIVTPPISPKQINLSGKSYSMNSRASWIPQVEKPPGEKW